ncbi:hypothetical protein D3C75_688080 [compost metagenome]
MHLLQIGRGHQDHHDDAGGEQPGQQHGDDDAALVFTEHRLEGQLLGQGLVGLHLGEDRGLVQPAAQVHGDYAEHTAEHEGQTPAPLAHLDRAHAAVDGGGHQGAEQYAGGQPCGEGAAGDADPAGGHVFGHEDPGPRDFAPDGGPLQDPQQQQQQRGGNAEGGIGGQQADQQGRQRHQDDAEGEHPLAADEIAEVGHDDAPQRAGQVTGGEDAEGLELAQPLGNVGREEELAYHHGEEDEDDEVVEFEGAAQRRQA